MLSCCLRSSWKNFTREHCVATCLPVCSLRLAVHHFLEWRHHGMDADQPFSVFRLPAGAKDGVSSMPVPREPARVNAQPKHGDTHASNSRRWSALACAAACGAASVRQVKRVQKRSAVNRKVYRVQVDLPDPMDVEKQIETVAGPMFAKDIQQAGRAATDLLHSTEKALPKMMLPELPKIPLPSLPAVPPELTAAVKQLAAKVEAAAPNLTTDLKNLAAHLPPDIAKVLLHPQAVQLCVGQPYSMA